MMTTASWDLRYTQTWYYGLCHLCDSLRPKLLKIVVESHPIVLLFDMIKGVEWRLWDRQGYIHDWLGIIPAFFRGHNFTTTCTLTIYAKLYCNKFYINCRYEMQHNYPSSQKKSTLSFI